MKNFNSAQSRPEKQEMSWAPTTAKGEKKREGENEWKIDRNQGKKMQIEPTTRNGEKDGSEIKSEKE